MATLAADRIETRRVRRRVFSALTLGVCIGLGPLVASAGSIETFESVGPVTGDDEILNALVLDGVTITLSAGNDRLSTENTAGHKIYLARVGGFQTSHGGPVVGGLAPSGSDSFQGASTENQWFLTERINTFLSYLFAFDQDVEGFQLDLYDWTTSSAARVAALTLYDSQGGTILGQTVQASAPNSFANDGIVHTMSVTGSAPGNFAALTFSGGGDNGIGIDNLQIIPEPTTGLLLTLGLAALGMRRRLR